MSDTLTIDQAVDIVTDGSVGTDSPEIERDDNAALEGAEISDDDQSSGEEGAETPAQVDEGAQPGAETPAGAPQFWSAEDKALFAELDPKAQAIILKADKAAEADLNRRREEAATERKATVSERKKLSELTGRITEAATLAETAFASRWGNITPEGWAALAEEKPAEYTALKARYDAEQHAVQQAKSARANAEAEAHNEFLSEQAEKLQTLCPALVDPVHGEKNLRELSDYLVKEGVDPDDLPHVNATQMTLARKAMLYDQGVAKLQQPRQPPATKPGLKPSGAESSSPQQRSSANAMARLSKSGSIDDAVEALIAKR